MSYLAGPLSREQVSTLTADSPERTARTAPMAETSSSPRAITTTAAAADLAEDETPVAPKVPDTTRVYHLDPAAPWAADLVDASSSRYQAGVVARVDLLYDDQYADVSHTEEWEAVFFPIGEDFDPDIGRAVAYDDRDLQATAPAGAVYVIPGARIDTKTFWTGVNTSIKAWLHANQKVEVFKNPALKLYSRVGESEVDFATRCVSAAEEKADEDIARLKDKYETRIKAVQDQLRAAERRVSELEVDVQSRRQQEVLSGAGDLLSVFLGGRRRSRSLSGAASRRAQTRRTQERLATASEKVTDKVADLEDLEDQLADDVQEIMAKWDEAATEVEVVEIGLEKTDITIDDIALLWIPTG